MLVLLAVLLASGASISPAAQDAAVGDVKFESSGSPEAEVSFLYGLAQLHNFEYASAAEAFRSAQAKDPGFAMAYWGEAMTYNHAIWMEQDRDAALSALERLAPTREERLAKAMTERERAYLDAVEVLYGEGTKRERDFAYAEAMARLHRKYPEDVDGAALDTLAILGTAHEGRDFATYMRAAAVSEEAFRDHPRHPGILHYLIHCYDDPVHAPLGLRPARLYAKVAPGAAHAQHMTSHIFVAMGLWADVVAANENAASVANRARQKRGRPESHCGHYNFWLLYGYLQQGRDDDAKKLLVGCREEAMHASPGAPVIDPDNSPLHSLLQMRTRYLIDSEAWGGDVAGWEIALGPEYVPERVDYEFIEGFAAARRGDLETARMRLARLQEARGELASFLENNPDELGPAVSKRADILESQIRGVLLLSEGRNEEAVGFLRSGAELEDSLPFMFGPPFVDEPSYELLGKTLLDLGKAPEALDAMERALSRAPERRAALVGVVKAAEIAGEEAKAADARARLASGETGSQTPRHELRR
jgi:tetratricopeptide (TPR) repeat protein